MRKLLVPCDGSDNALRAVRHAAALAGELRDVRLELLYVADPVPLRMHASLSSQEIMQMQTEECDQILQSARQILDTAACPYQISCRAGSPASEIAHHVHEHGCDAIIMGTRGLGPVAGAMIGSVAMRVINLVHVPVTLVK